MLYSFSGNDFHLSMCLRLYSWPTKSTHYSFFPLPGISENKVQRSSYCILVVLTKWNHNHLEYFCLIILIQQSCTRALNDILCHSVYISVADPDLQIRWGGGGVESLRPWDKGEGGLKIFFTAFRGSVWSKKRGSVGTCPGCATTSNPLYRTNVRKTLKCFFCDQAILDDSQGDPSQLGPHSAYGSSWENTRSHSRWRWSSRWATVWITIWSYF